MSGLGHRPATPWAARWPHGSSARAFFAVPVALATLVVACAPRTTSTLPSQPTSSRSGEPATAAAPGSSAAGTGRAASGGASTASAIYAAVAPQVAYVESSLSTGSAVRLAGGDLLTNAHVVWPDEAVRVVFADGSTWDGARVAHTDLMADLAIIERGPTEAGGAPPSTLPLVVAGADTVAVGDELFLVGYPGESEDNPQPAISRGLASRLRQWPAMGLRYIQSDAAIAGGQSGGALVDGHGRLVGISCMTFGDGAFGLSLSAADAMARAERMLGDEDVDGITERALPRSGGETRHELALADAWQEAVLVGWFSYGQSLDLRIASGPSGAVDVLNPYGEVVASTTDVPGAQEAEWTAVDPGPHVAVAYLDDGGGTLEVTSSPALAPFDDPDDSGSPDATGVRTGALDFPGDVDVLYVELEGGRAYSLTVDTVSFYPQASLQPVDAAVPVPKIDPEVGGALGMTLTARVVASGTGRYALTVRDPDDIGFGGYLVSIVPEL